MSNKSLIKAIYAILAVLLLVALFIGIRQNANKEEIVLGAIVPLTDNSSDLGIATSQAMELCADEWNKKGGIEGKKIVLDINDSHSDPKLGITLAQKIMSRRTPLMVYSLVSGVALNVQRITKEKQSILMACVGSVELFDNDKDFTLRNFISPGNVGDGISDYLVENFKEQPLTILYINNTFGESYARMVRKFSADKGIHIRQVIAYDEANNYRDVIVKSNLTSNDILYIAGVGKSIGVLIKQLREQGYNGVILGDPNLPNNSALAVAGDKMKNVFFLDIDKPDSEEYNNFVKTYTSKYHSVPDNFAIIAYATCGYLLDLAHENKTLSTQEIMKIANSGYVFKSIIGDISVVNNEFVFPTKITCVEE